jgi:ribosomal protein S18 acetylase RimI-like enzyme
MSLRPMTLADIEPALVLWQRCAGLGLSAADSPCALKKFLERNSGLSFVAEEDGQIVGTILGGQDGRRGYFYHLAVSPERRRQGIGEGLVTEALAAMKAQGIQKCHIMVYRANEEGRQFWQKVGWKLRSEIDLLSFDVEPSQGQCPC